MKFVSKGPLFVDVHMHRPTIASRPFMDSLLAFWPGLQVTYVVNENIYKKLNENAIKLM